jgi:hypothetical protein
VWWLENLSVDFANQLPDAEITAPVVGGNLSVLVSMLGSSTFSDLGSRSFFVKI